MSSHDRAVYFGELEHRRRQERESVKAILNVTDNFVKLIAFDGAGDNGAHYLRHVVDICNKSKIPDEKLALRVD